MALNKTVSSESGNALVQKGDGAYLDQGTLSATSALEWLIPATHRNTMYRLADGSSAPYSLPGMMVDEFEDQTGVDTAASTGENYSTGAYDNGGESAVAAATGTKIGDMTYGGGLAAIFDGVTNAAYPSATGAMGFGGGVGNVGKNWGAGNTKIISSARVYASNNGGFTASLTATNITIYLEGSTNGSSWTTLGSTGPFTDAASLNKLITTTSLTPYQYHRIRIVRADGGPNVCAAEVVFYDLVITDMVLLSYSITADEVPTTIRLLMRAEFSDTLNTDLKAYISRDDGKTWTQGTLAKISEEGDVDYFETIVDVSGQPSDTDLRWKITTHNDKSVEIHAVALNW